MHACCIWQTAYDSLQLNSLITNDQPHCMAFKGLNAADASCRQSTLPLARLGLQVSRSKLTPGPDLVGPLPLCTKAALHNITTSLHLQEPQGDFNATVKGLQQPHRSYNRLPVERAGGHHSPACTCRYLNRIDAAVNGLKQETDGAPVTLLAHSAGGWLGRLYLLGFGTAGIDRLVSIGSPHQPPPQVGPHSKALQAVCAPVRRLDLSIWD